MTEHEQQEHLVSSDVCTRGGHPTCREVESDTEGRTDTGAERQTDRQTDRQRQTDTDRQTDGQRQTDRQTYRQTDRLTDRQTDTDTFTIIPPETTGYILKQKHIGIDIIPKLRFQKINTVFVFFLESQFWNYIDIVPELGM